MRALSAMLGSAGIDPPSPDRLHTYTLVGDLVGNSLYYAAVPAGTRGGTWQRGAVLGLLAGIGALMLPRPLGLGTPPHSETLRNQIMTVAWYLIGGLAAAAAADAMRETTRDAERYDEAAEAAAIEAMRGLGF